MSIFIRSMDIGTWPIVENGYTKPKDKLEKDYNAIEKAAYLSNFKALNAIVCVISPDEFRRISGL